MDKKWQSRTKTAIILSLIFVVVRYALVINYGLMSGALISKTIIFTIVTYCLYKQLFVDEKINYKVQANAIELHKFIIFRCVMFIFYQFVPIIVLIIDYAAAKDEKGIEFVKESDLMNTQNNLSEQYENYKKSILERICPICKTTLLENNNICPNCGIDLDKSLEEMNKTIETQTLTQKVPVTEKDFDPLFDLSEKDLINTMIERTMVKAQYDDRNAIPKNLLIRKIIMSIIFSILVFVFISLFFFHFPVYSYVIGLVILIILFIYTRKLTIKKYIAKEFKSRPSENMLNVVLSLKENSVKDTSKVLSFLLIVGALALSFYFYKDPHIIYEPLDEGYSVRFYITGLSSLNKAEIPSTYKGKEVISLRGNCFSNMFFLEEAVIPDTVKEIRGEAFLNDKKLKRVTLPNNLQEIKGSMFENCTSLERIVIPDSVTRIGGHAFYNNTSLSSVIISESSSLQEIGSSAFRLCSSLRTITIPANTVVNERAFKESPTTVSRYGPTYNYYNSSYNYNSGYYTYY